MKYSNEVVLSAETCSIILIT